MLPGYGGTRLTLAELSIVATKTKPGRVRRILTTSLTMALVFLVAGVGGYFGYERLFPRPVQVPITTTRATRGTISQLVTSSGQTVATNTANLGFPASGKLQSINVQVGDEVQAGQELARLETRNLELAVQQAQANLLSAQASYSKTAAGSTEADIIAARGSVLSSQGTVISAQNSYDTLVKPKSSDDLASVTAALEKARAALQTAQTAYDQVSWKNDASSSSAATTLQTATADYNSALAAYNLAIAPPTEGAVRAARQSIETANENLKSSEAKLATLLAGPASADLAVSRAAVDNAAAALETARYNLEGATLRAPFAGRISTLTGNIGETISANFITLVDTTKLRVDVAVDETDAGKLRVGQPVTATFDSLSSLAVSGTVSSIAPVATTTQGVSTFPIRIPLNIEPGQNILAGMTAQVRIVIAQKENVVLVQSRALTQAGNNRSVRVQNPDGTIELRPVRIGLTDDTMTEIVSGLQEGETVVIPTTTTTGGTGGTQRTTTGFPGGGGTVVFGPGGGGPARPPGGGG